MVETAVVMVETAAGMAETAAGTGETAAGMAIRAEGTGAGTEAGLIVQPGIGLAASTHDNESVFK